MDDAPDRLSQLEARIRLVEDKQAIHDVIVRYCRGVDRAEPALILTCFHDDAVDNHFGVLLPFREAVGALKAPPQDPAAPPKRTTSTHQICNVLIEVEGEVARAESYLIIFARFAHEGRTVDWLVSGRFVDRFERRNGDWRIAHRTVVYDLDRFDDASPAPDSLSAAHYLDNAIRGLKGKADYSYDHFPRLEV